MADSIAIGGTNWVSRTHPNYKKWSDVQTLHRASYVASRDTLSPFLVPHRFEGKQELDPTTLRRSSLGYGIGLNASYLAEIMGHVRGAVARYTWGPISPEDEGAIISPPQGDMARIMWEDVTRDGTSWRNLWLRKILEWDLSSPGGVVVVDTPSQGKMEGDPTRPTIAQAKALGLRPFQRFVRFSEVKDYGWGPAGFRWVKIEEPQDTRDPKEEKTKDGKIHVLYELVGDGETQLSRWDSDGKMIGDLVTLGKLVDRQNQPTLPVILSTYGEHESLPQIGSGLLTTLSDIIVDLFNTMSEMREGYRDAAFGVTAYKGTRGKKVQGLLEEGSRFFDLGDEEEADLFRVAGNAEEVTSGLSIVDLGLRAWSWAARQKAADAMSRSSGGPRSGVSLEAEFQLDLVPLLREISSGLDQDESAAMFIVGQMMQETPEALDRAGVGVARSQEFRVEEESSRISRIVEEFLATDIPLPPELQAEIGKTWTESLDFVDLDQEVTIQTLDGEETTTLREVLSERFLERAEAKAAAERNLGVFGGPGSLPPFPTGEEEEEEEEEEDV